MDSSIGAEIALAGLHHGCSARQRRVDLLFELRKRCRGEAVQSRVQIKKTCGGRAAAWISAREGQEIASTGVCRRCSRRRNRNNDLASERGKLIGGIGDGVRASWEPDGWIAVDMVDEAVQVVQAATIHAQPPPWDRMRQEQCVASTWRSGGRWQMKRLADTVA